MKNRKNIVLGALVAVMGSSIALGSAYALYTQSLDDKVITIGTNTAMDVSLKVGEITGDTNSTLAPGQDRSFKFSMQAVTGASSTYTQPYYLAELDVTISSDSSELLEAMKTSTFTVENEAGNFFTTDGSTESSWKENDQNVVKFTEAVINTDENDPSNNTMTGVAYLPLPTGDAPEALFATANITLGDIGGDEFLAISEQSYNIDIELKAPTNYDFAYVVGTMNNWTSVDAYQMVPNPKSEAFQWMYQFEAPEDGTAFADGTAFKCKKTITSSESEIVEHSGGEDYVWNVEYEKTQTHNAIFWSGSKLDALVVGTI